MLIDKFRKIIESRNLLLTPEEKESLARDFDRVVQAWLDKPEEERARYLANQMERLVNRYRRHWSVSILGKPATPGKKDLSPDLSHYFKRTLARVEKEAALAGYQRSSRVNAGFQIKSIQPAGDFHKVVSHFHISNVPSYIVRRGVLRTRRKGSLKIAEVRFGMVLE